MLKSIGKDGTKQHRPSQLDSALCEQLDKLVEDMTHSGSPSLEEKPLKQLKKICRISDAYVEHAFHLLSNQLAEEHAEIRLSSFQIMNELFNRSHRFRELLVADMQEFLALTVETVGDYPLPPPKAAAKLLKEQTLKAVQEWNNKYGKAYKKLALGYGFLKYNKVVDFANLEARSAAERRAQAARQAKMQVLMAQKISRALTDMEETIPEINECLTQIENCFELLLPNPARFDNTDVPSNKMVSPSTKSRSATQKGGTIDSEGLSGERVKGKLKGNDGESSRHDDGEDVSDEMEEDDDEDSLEGEEEETGEEGKDASLLQQHGLPSWNYNIDIDINTEGVVLQEDEDNQDILTTLEDMNRLASSAYLPRLAVWMEVFSKSGKNVNQLKRCIDLKQALINALAKQAELKVQRKKSERERRGLQVGDVDGEDSDSDGGEFEDVPVKEGFEPVIPDHLRAEYGLDPLPSTSQESQPSTSSSSINKSKHLNAETLPATSFGSALGGDSWNTPCGSGAAKGSEWHPLREAQHVLSDPASQAGTIKVMKERLRVIREQFPIKRRSTETKTLTVEEQQRRQLLAKAPVVPFGVDLEHWANPENIEAPMVMLPETAQWVWSTSVQDEVKIMEHAKDSLTTRVFNYTGEFEPVKWTCRAPLPSGKLCLRMDRYKCPFHGKIVPRDDKGNPKEDQPEFQMSKEQQKQAKALVTDPSLQRDIEKGLGRDLGGPSTSGKGQGGKKGKGKAKKYPNLTDLRKTTNTSVNRLGKKVLNKSSLRRVANAMNKMEQRRYQDKFGNNFNYR
ncbi:UV-stimulated scaffold protein A-like [Asterias rubens]|uniref:UV-stimulated scaffold protein A-like n=1 Tax=Asterias rubens TaxID=7604 RepID=UPI00145580C7|nr:UV-stimulated scaffold protein A-like [Asterias rubens]XP_033632590.1 UV-stimulated scaffold protein A-like [Asterias rubens]